MSLDETTRALMKEAIRDLVKEVIDELQIGKRLIPQSKFCAEMGIDRKTLYTARKQNKVQEHKIGRKVFIDANQPFTK